MRNASKAVESANFKNNGSSIMLGGNTSDPATNPLGLDVLGHFSGVHGSKVPGPTSAADQSQGNGLTAAAVSGNFAKQTNTSFVILGANSSLAGNSTTVLSGSYSSPRKAIPFRWTRKMFKVRTAGWNFATGAFISAPTGFTEHYGEDDAALPTDEIPGEFVIREGGATPSQKDYEAR